MKNITLKDIAKKVGASTSTVSLVLNGHWEKRRISKDLADKIFKTAKELNYKPNLPARGLRLGHTRIIGLVVADISNPFFAKIGRSIEDNAAKYGYRLITCSSDENDQKSDDLIDALINRQVDGLIIAPTLNTKEKILELSRYKFPFVLIDRYFNLATNQVKIDNFQAAFDCVDHMLSFGYKRVAMLTHSYELLHMNERVKGYKAALKKYGIRFDSRLLKEIPYTDTSRHIYNAIKELTGSTLNARAIFFPTNRLGIPGLECLYDMKLRIPQDIAVTIFDDNEYFKLMYPPITALQQPIYEFGEKAVELLLDDINGKLESKKEIVLQSELIIRESGGK